MEVGGIANLHLWDFRRLNEEASRPILDFPDAQMGRILLLHGLGTVKGKVMDKRTEIDE